MLYVGKNTVAPNNVINTSIEQVQSDYAQVDTTAVDYIKNKPTLASVATSGDYNDLSNTPIIPTVNDATLTITQGGVSKGTFTANASGDVTVDLIDTTYSAFTGSDGVNAGSSGLVPAPTAVDNEKFLKGDGTWATVSGGGASYTAGNGIDITNNEISVASPTLINTAENPNTRHNLTISGTSNANNGAINIGYGSSATGNYSTVIGESSYSSANQGTAIGSTAGITGLRGVGVGYNSIATRDSVAIGATSEASENYSTAIGQNSHATAQNAFALGTSARATAQGAIQIGGRTNSEPYTLYVGQYGYNNYKLLDLTTGKIPSERLDVNEAASVTNQNTDQSAATPLKVWEGTSTQYTNQARVTIDCYGWSNSPYIMFTDTETPQVGDICYGTAWGRYDPLTITDTDGSTYITTDQLGTATRDTTLDYTHIIPGAYDDKTLCFIEGEGIKRNGIDIASLGNYTAGTGIDITNNRISVTSPTLTNTATGQNSLAILERFRTTGEYNVNIGGYATAQSGVAVGFNAQSRKNYSVSIGIDSDVEGNFGIAIGNYARAFSNKSIAIGNFSYVTTNATSSIQIGEGTNDEANSVKFGNGTNNYKLLDLTTGKIPADRLPSTAPSIDNTTITKNSSDQLQASSVMNARTGTDVMPIWQGTEQQWTNGKATDWYNWKTDISADISAGTLGSSYNRVIYGNGIYIATPLNGNTVSYSSNGTTWNSATLPTSATNIRDGVYGNEFVIVTNSGTCFISTDGITWTQSQISSTVTSGWGSIAFGNGKYIAIKNDGLSTNAAISSDGITWTGVTLPANKWWQKISYGNGVFVVCCGAYYGEQNTIAYSTDGNTWNIVNLPYNAYWTLLTYGDSQGFMLFGDNRGTKYAYKSVDGTTWTQISNPGFYPEDFNVTYGNGFYVGAIGSVFYYSQDGNNWSTFNAINRPGAIAFDGTNFITGVYNTNYSNGNIFYLGEMGCYTIEATPTTASTVYSAPNTPSALTITSVSTGTITLSDNNTYTYTSSGDITTYQTIGEAYPNYLANINGVGVKIGNTLIADNTELTAGTGIDITDGVISGTDYVEVADFTRDLTDTSILKIVPFTSGYTFHKDKIYVMRLAIRQDPVGGEPTPIADNTPITIQDGTGSVINFMIGDDQATTFKNIKAFLRPWVNPSNKRIMYRGNILGILSGVGSPWGMTFVVCTADNNPADMQTTTNLVTSVSSSSTDTQYPSAKLFYDTVGNIEATLDAIIAQGSNS